MSAEFLAPDAPAEPARLRRHCEDLVGLLGHLVTVKMPYGDGLHRVRRTRATAPAFPDLRFVTGVLADLDMDSGKLRYINAGHPPPILLRHGKAIRTLIGGRRMPMGIDDSAIEVGEEMLEPEDRLLLYTDGVVEAHGPGADRFGVPRLVDFAERCAAEELPGPETLRRLTHTVLSHQGGAPTDDATLLLLEWSGAAAQRTQP